MPEHTRDSCPQQGDQTPQGTLAWLPPEETLKIPPQLIAQVNHLEKTYYLQNSQEPPKSMSTKSKQGRHCLTVMAGADHCRAPLPPGPSLHTQKEVRVSCLGECIG